MENKMKKEQIKKVLEFKKPWWKKIFSIFKRKKYEPFKHYGIICEKDASGRWRHKIYINGKRANECIIFDFWHRKEEKNNE